MFKPWTNNCRCPLTAMMMLMRKKNRKNYNEPSTTNAENPFPAAAWITSPGRLYALSFPSARDSTGFLEHRLKGIFIIMHTARYVKQPHWE